MAKSKKKVENKAPKRKQVAIPQWCAKYYVNSLEEIDITSLYKFVGDNPDLTKNEAALRGAFLAFVITDLEDKRVFTTVKDALLFTRRSTGVVDILFDAAQSLNGEVYNNFINNFATENKANDQRNKNPIT